MMEISWKLCAGKLGGCWWLHDGGNYGTILQYHTTISRQWGPGAIAEHPSSTDLSRMMPSVKQDDMDAQPTMVPRPDLSRSAQQC